MSLFKRSKAHGRGRDRADDSTRGRATSTTADDDDEADDGAAARRRERTAAARAAAQIRAAGPFDVAEVDDVSELIDLGAILVAPVDGMELRLELNEEDGEHVVGVTVLLGESAVQVQAFAAPRSEGIWDEVRAEIASGITQQGGTADEADGAFGRELLARVPGPGPDGKPGLPAGPLRRGRRAALVPAGGLHRRAVDQAKAGPVEDLVRSLVVVRGGEAMAPRELLPLQIPTAPRDAPAGSGGRRGRRSGRPYADDLNPFERGPEITEIR